MVKSTEKRTKEDGEHKPLTGSHSPSHVVEGLDDSDSFQSIPLQELSVTGLENQGFQDDVTTTPVNGANNNSEGKVWVKNNIPASTNTGSNPNETKKKDDQSGGKIPQNGDTDNSNLNTFGRQKNQTTEKNNINGNHTTPKLPIQDDTKSPGVEHPIREYYIPVNTHRKLLRGEKLYLTHDKRSPNRRSWRKIAICGIVWTFIAVICITAALAATGVILSKPMQTEDYNSDYSQWSSGKDDNEDKLMNLLTVGTEVYPTVDSDISIFDISLKTYKGTMRLENVKYDEALNNSNTLQYQSLSSHLEKLLYEVYRPLSVSKVKVEQFRAGSVWVDFLLAWEYMAMNLPTDEIELHMEIHLNITHNYLDKYLVNSSTVKISDAMQDHRQEFSTSTEDSQPSYFMKESTTTENALLHSSKIQEMYFTKERPSEMTTLLSFYYHLTTTRPSKIELETESTSTASSSTLQESNRISNYGKALGGFWNTIENHTEVSSSSIFDDMFTSPYEITHESTTSQEYHSDGITELTTKTNDDINDFSDNDESVSTTSEADLIIPNETTTFKLKFSDYDTKSEISNTNPSTETNYIERSSSTTSEKQFTINPNNEHSTSFPEDTTTSTITMSFFDLLTKKLLTNDNETNLPTELVTSDTKSDNETNSMKPSEKITLPFLFHFFTTQSNIGSENETITEVDTTLSDMDYYSAENKSDIIPSTNTSSVIKLVTYNMTDNSTVVVTTSVNNESRVTTDYRFPFFTIETEDIVTSENTDDIHSTMTPLSIDEEINTTMSETTSDISVTSESSNSTSLEENISESSISTTESSIDFFNETKVSLMFPSEREANFSFSTMMATIIEEASNFTNMHSTFDTSYNLIPNISLVASELNTTSENHNITDIGEETSSSPTPSSYLNDNAISTISTHLPIVIINSSSSENQSGMEETASENSQTDASPVSTFPDISTPPDISNITNITNVIMDITRILNESAIQFPITTVNTSTSEINIEENIQNVSTTAETSESTVTDSLMQTANLTNDTDNMMLTITPTTEFLSTESLQTETSVEAAKTRENLDDDLIENSQQDNYTSTTVTEMEKISNTNSTNFTLYPLITKENYRNFTSDHNKVFFSSVSDEGQSTSQSNETIQLDATVKIDEKNDNTSVKSSSSDDFTQEITTVNDFYTTEQSSPNKMDEVTYMSDVRQTEEDLTTSTFSGNDSSFRALDGNESAFTPSTITPEIPADSSGSDISELTHLDIFTSSISPTLNNNFSEHTTETKKNFSQSDDILKVEFNIGNQINLTVTPSETTTDMTQSNNLLDSTTETKTMSSSENDIISSSSATNQTGMSRRIGFISIFDNLPEQTTTEVSHTEESTSDGTTSSSGISSTVSSTDNLSTESSIIVQNFTSTMLPNMDDTTMSWNKTESDKTVSSEKDTPQMDDAATASTATTSPPSEIITKNMYETTSSTVTDDTNFVISTLDYFSNNFYESNTPSQDSGEISYTNNKK